MNTANGNFSDISSIAKNQYLRAALGLTISLGYLLPHDDWLIKAQYENIDSAIASFTNNVDNPLLGLRVEPETFTSILINTDFNHLVDIFNQAIYNAGFDLQQLNVYLVKGSFYSNCYSFDPYIGIQAIWFQLEQITSFDSPFFAFGNVIYFAKIDKSFGVGPLTGFLSEYYLTKGTSFFFDSNFGVLYGDARSTFTTAITGLENSQVPQSRASLTTNYLDCNALFSIRTILGVKFEDYFYKNYLSLKIGYDVRAVITSPSHFPGFAMEGLYVAAAVIF